MVYDAVLLINQYSRFQDKLMILYPTVEILRKVHSMKMCVHVYSETSITNYTGPRILL